MALRSLGSTLVAKAGTGSALRQKDETRMGGMIPEQAAGAQPESQVRQQVQSPMEIPVPQGSQKVISTQPIMQPKLDVAGIGSAMPQGLLGEMGGAGAAAATGRPIGTITQAKNPTVQAGAAPVSGGTNIATKLSNTFGSSLTPEQKTSYAKGVTAPNAQPTPTPVQVKNTAPTSYNPIGFLEGTMGGTVRADENKGLDFERNLAQGIASTLGGFIDSAGKFLQNPLPETNFSENLQKFASSPNTAGIIQNVKSGAQQASQAASNAVQNVAKAATGWLAPAPAKAAAPAPKPASGGGAAGGGGGSWGSTPAKAPAPKPAPKQNVVQQAVNWLRSLFR